MMQFAWPWLFLALPLPLLIAWLFPAAQSGREAALRVPFFNDIADASHGMARPRSRARLPLVLGTFAWLLLVLAAARPQWLGEAIQLPITGRDLMLAVDISGSMSIEDMQLHGSNVPRLIAVKAVVGEFVERRQGDRLGLILFGEQAYLQTPLTFDRATVRNMLEESAVGLAGKATAIGDGIGQAVKRLRELPAESRVLVLLTDGANTAGAIAPLQAAKLAAQENIRIYTIGIGADEMVVNSLFGQRRINPSADLDEKTLKAIAAETGGRYFRARDTEGLNAIYQELDQLEPLASDERTYRPLHDLYLWPLGAALLLAAGLMLITLFQSTRHIAREAEQ